MKKQESMAKTALIAASLIWGAGFIFSQFALDAGIGPAGIMMLRFTVAAIVFGIMYRRPIRQGMSLRVLGRAIPIGMILALGFFTQTVGLSLSTPSNNALITAVYVVITPFLWQLVFKKKPPAVAYISSVLCFIGVAALTFDFANGLYFRVGDLWTLLAALLFASQIVATEAFVRGTDYRVLLFIEMATAAIVCAALFFITERDLSGLLTIKGAGSILYLSVLSTCACYIMQTSAQRYVASDTAALILSLESLFGPALSILIGYDEAEPKLIIGACMIMVSILLPELVSIIKKQTAEKARVYYRGLNSGFPMLAITQQRTTRALRRSRFANGSAVKNETVAEVV